MDAAPGPVQAHSRCKDPVSSVFATITTELSQKSHTRLFLPYRLGSVITVLLEDAPLAPVTTSCSPRQGHSQLCGQQSTLNPAKHDLVARETPWEQREDPAFPRGHEAIIGQNHQRTQDDVTMDAGPGVRSPGHPFNLDRHVSLRKPVPAERRLVHGDRHLISLLSDALPRAGSRGGICILSTLISIHELIVY